MDDVRSNLAFLWSPGFRPIPIPEFQDKGGTFALAKLVVTGGKYEGEMQLSFKGKASPARVARFIVSLGETLSGPGRWASERDLDLHLSFSLSEGRDRSTLSPLDRQAHDAAVMVRHYLKLMQLCGIPYERAPVPRIVLDFVYSPIPPKAVPLGKHLVMRTLAELRPGSRL